MKLYYILLLILNSGCSLELSRVPSSEEKSQHLEVDVEKSSIHLMSPKRFLVHIKNAESQNMEISFTEVKVKNGSGKVIPFQLERVNSGQYYVLPLSHEKEIQISIQDKLIGRKFKLTESKPDKERTSITIVSRGGHSLCLKLKLADKNNRPLVTENPPEIMVEGEGGIEDLKPLGKGAWEFTLKYPESNGIIYLSVRSQEVFLEHIFRFQHVEK